MLGFYSGEAKLLGFDRNINKFNAYRIGRGNLPKPTEVFAQLVTFLLNHIIQNLCTE